MANDSMITPELLDQLLVNYSRPEDLLGEEGLFKLLKKALIERALGAELPEHLGYEKGDPAGRGSGNNRDCVGSKTVLTGAADEDRRAAGSRRELRASIGPQGADQVRGL